MLQMIRDGPKRRGHESELVFFEDGPWPQELARDGFRVEVIEVGRLRQARRTLAAIVQLARLLRRRNPDLILDWSAKTHIYGAPAGMLAGLAGRLVWFQQVIPDGHWIDCAATALPGAPARRRWLLLERRRARPEAVAPRAAYVRRRCRDARARAGTHFTAAARAPDGRRRRRGR